MFKFTFTFMGRQRGAIGIFHKCRATVQARSEDEAELKPYDHDEHIHDKKLIQKFSLKPSSTEGK